MDMIALKSMTAYLLQSLPGMAFSRIAPIEDWIDNKQLVTKI